MTEEDKQETIKTFAEQYGGTHHVANHGGKKGIGHDIAQLRLVSAFDWPNSPESYFQES